MSHLLSLIPYEDIPREKIKLPPRQNRHTSAHRKGIRTTSHCATRSVKHHCGSSAEARGFESAPAIAKPACAVGPVADAS